MSISNSLIIETLFIIAPQFVTTNPTTLANYNFILDNVIRPQVNAAYFGCNALMAYVFLLAAYLSLSANPNLGTTSNMTEGDLSIGFNVSPTSDFLSLTPWGRAYQDLVRRMGFGATVTNLPVNMGGVAQYVPNNGCGCGPWNAGN